MRLRRVFIIVCVLMALFTSVAFAQKITYYEPGSNGNPGAQHTVEGTMVENSGYTDADGNYHFKVKDSSGNIKEYVAYEKEGSNGVDVTNTASDILNVDNLPGYDMLNKIEESFRKMSITGIDRLRGPAMTLLWSLGVISIASTWMLYEGQLRLSFVIETVMKIGFYTFLVMYWGTITGDIGDTFQNAGALASMGSVGSKIDWNAGKVLQLGFKCVAEIWSNITLVGTIAHPIDSIIRVIGLFCVLAGYLLLAFEMLVTRVEWSIFRCLSLIFLPLGVLRFTAGFAQGAIRGMFSYGAKLMVITFLTGIIFEQTQLTNTVLKKDASTPETLCLGFAFLALAWIVKSAGALAQGLVSGSPSLSGGAMKAAAAGMLGTGVGMVAGAYANASASSPGAALVGKAAGAMATGGTGAIAMGMAGKMGMSMAQMTTAMQTMTAASGGGDGGGGGSAVQKVAGGSDDSRKPKPTKAENQHMQNGDLRQQQQQQQIQQQQDQQVMQESQQADANAKQQQQNALDQNAVKPNAENVEAVKNAAEGGNLEGRNAEGAVAGQEGAEKGKSAEDASQGESVDNKVEAGDISAVAGATANANETATNNVVSDEDKGDSQESGDESEVEADKEQAEDVGEATGQPASDMTDDEYKNMVGEDAQDTMSEADYNNVVGEDASKSAENSVSPAGTTVEHGVEQPAGGENAGASAIQGDMQAAAAIGAAAMAGTVLDKNGQPVKQSEGTPADGKSVEAKQGNAKPESAVPPVGAPASKGEGGNTDAVRKAAGGIPPIGDGTPDGEQKRQEKQEERKTQEGLQGEKSASETVNETKAQVSEAEKAEQAKVNGMGDNVDKSDAQKLQEFAQAHPTEYAYLAAYSKVFDENGNVKASATDDDKANFMYAKGQYERHQQALEAFKEQQQMEAAAKAYQQKSTASKALGFAGRFTKELAIQAVSNLGPVDFLMDQAQIGVSRARRFRRFQNDKWKTYDSVGGEVSVQRD